MKLFKFLFIIIALFTFTQAANVEDIANVMKKDGYSNFNEISAIPSLLRGPMVSVAMLTNGKWIFNARGERLGRIYEDYVAIGEDTYTFQNILTADKGEAAYVILFGSDLIMFITDCPVRKVGRFMAQIIFVDSGKDVKIFLK